MTKDQEILCSILKTVNACNKHLDDNKLSPDGNAYPFYEKVDDTMVNEAVKQTKLVLEEGKDNDI